MTSTASVRCPQRRAQGGGRGHAPARTGAAGRGRADGLRSHRDPAPVAAAHLAPPEAAGRGRAGRALPRGRLGVLPAWPSRRRRRARAHADRAARSRRPDRSRATASGWPPCARRAPPRRRTISARTPPNGTASASCTSPTTRSRRRSATALADQPFRSLLDLGTGTGRMLELFGPEIERGLGIDLSLDMLLLARARLERAGLRHCSVRQGDIYDLPLPTDSFDVVIIHQVLHFLDDGGARDPRGRARAAPRAAGCWWSTSRRTIWNSCARSMRTAGSASPPETVAQWMSAAGLDMALHTQPCRPSPAPTARSRCRSGSRAIRAHRWPSPSARSRDELPASPAGSRTANAASASRSSSSRRRPRRWRRRCGRRSSGSRRWRPNFVSVTYGAGGSTRERTHATVKRILGETALTPAAHLTCVAATRAEIDEVIARLSWAAGVRHIVALRGDPAGGIGEKYAPHPGGYQQRAPIWLPASSGSPTSRCRCRPIRRSIRTARRSRPISTC